MEKNVHATISKGIMGYDQYTVSPGGGGTPHLKGVGILVGNFELNP